jgi:hypothetical protein
MTKIYLDQCIYGNILDAPSTDWRYGEVAAILLSAQREGRGEVWVSPTHVIETALTLDPDRRTRLASVMLELAAARRMWWGSDHEAVADFFSLIGEIIPDALRIPAYFTHRVETTRQIWLGALALLAACPWRDIDGVVGQLARTKSINQLRHARFAIDPDGWVQRMIDTVEHTRTTVENDHEFDSMSLEEIRSEVHRLAGARRRLSNPASRRLQRNRDRVARAYGAMEIGRHLPTIFTLPMELSLILDLPRIVEHWPAMQRATDCAALPDTVRQADRAELCVNPSLFREIVQCLIYAVVNVGLVSTTISFETVLRELQSSINDRDIPSGGLTFDADHAAYLPSCTVFMTTDEAFAASLRTMAARLAQQTGGRVAPQIVGNALQLSRAIETAATTYPLAVSKSLIEVFATNGNLPRAAERAHPSAVAGIGFVKRSIPLC